jgi:hypothetical protein
VTKAIQDALFGIIAGDREDTHGWLDYI